MCYTDTDSFIFEIKTENAYKDFKKYKQFLDLSNYNKNNELYSKKNKKALGYIKDEANGEIIEQLIALKSKLYSIKFLSGDVIKKCKGVQNIVVQKYIHHEYYENVLKNENIIYSENRRIESKNFNLRSVKIQKITHTPFDDKRFICKDKITTKAFGFKM